LRLNGRGFLSQFCCCQPTKPWANFVTHVPLSPSNRICCRTQSSDAPHSWEDKCGSGVALAMRHRLQWFIHLWAQIREISIPPTLLVGSGTYLGYFTVDLDLRTMHTVDALLSSHRERLIGIYATVLSVCLWLSVCPFFFSNVKKLACC